MGVKLKFPGKGKPKPKQMKQGTRKKRKVESSEDDTLTPLSTEGEEGEEEDAVEEAEDENPYGAGPSQPSKRRSRRQSIVTSAPPSNPQGLFDDDDNVELVQSTSASLGGDPPRSLSPSPQPTRAKRGKRKATAAVLTSDDDEGISYVDAGARNDDADQDFVVDSPPRKSSTGTKRGGATGRGRGSRGGRGRGGATEPPIKIKDERRTDTGNNSGLKRRRDSTATITNTNMDIDTNAGPSQPSAENTPSTQPPPRKLSKLPSMRKKPGLGPPTAGASGAGTPKTELGLARKPTAAKAQQTADLDLSSKDVYNSLFKGTGVVSAPRAGVNTRVKEEERKKELMKMRDEARAARIAALQKGTFDLAQGQERIAAFEEELRARNSPALYPNHLGSSIKFYYLEQQKMNSSPELLTGNGEDTR